MATRKWQMDPAHSEVHFKARHMMVSNVTGEFEKFNAEMETEDFDFSTAKISFTAEIDSVNTKVEQRDNHLRSPDFFDAENHPQMTFESTKLIKKSDDEYDMEGNLTLRGITKPITFQVENTGMIKDDWGNHRAGFEITGTINRKDFGLVYNAMMEVGGAVVSDKIKIAAAAEMISPANE